MKNKVKYGAEIVDLKFLGVYNYINLSKKSFSFEKRMVKKGWIYENRNYENGQSVGDAVGR